MYLRTDLLNFPYTYLLFASKGQYHKKLFSDNRHRKSENSDHSNDTESNNVTHRLRNLQLLCGHELFLTT